MSHTQREYYKCPECGHLVHYDITVSSFGKHYSCDAACHKCLLPIKYIDDFKRCASCHKRKECEAKKPRRVLAYKIAYKNSEGEYIAQT